MTFVISSFLWILFFFTHSFFAATSVKEKLTFKWKWSERKYRFMYSLLSVVLVVPIFGIQLYYSKSSWISLGLIWKVAGVILIFIGLIFNLLAFKNISAREFLGLTERKNKKEKLIQNGIYIFVRHPIYTGIIALFIGLFLVQATLYNALNFGWILLYLPIGIYLEEQKLVQLYGEDYKEYRRKVKSIIPFIL
ncbi:MAG: hypothetical protein RL264_1879 [Bacteroidota bacterium]